MIEFMPQKDWMLLEPHAECVNALGIILPDTWHDPNQDRVGERVASFKVVAKGPEAGVEIGDELIMEGLATPSFQYRGKWYFAGRAEQIVFKVKGGEESGGVTTV